MLKRTLTLAFILLGLPVAGSAFDLVDDLLGIAQSAPWPIERVEADVQALAIGPLRTQPMDKVVDPLGFEDEHYWSVARRLTVPFAGSEAQGLLGCSRIGREGWKTVLEQARQPFVPLSSDAGSRAIFLGHFADDPHPFPDDAYLHLECRMALVPSAPMLAGEAEEFLQASADRLREQFSDVRSEPISAGFFEPGFDGIVATGGQALRGHGLDTIKVNIDPNGTINVIFSAWATVTSS